MTIKILKKNIIKIPKNISIYFCNDNILTLIGPLGIKSIKLKTKIKISNKNNFIAITHFPIDTGNISTNEKKFCVCVCGTYVAIIKQVINEITQKSKKKLNIVGVGYRAMTINSLDFSILHLKLGYSHQIYIKIPKSLILICPKPTKIFIFGYKQQKINQLAALIRSYKIPEPYKGKGIFYDNENIILKKGKKI
jgi:large subunit ribosomal protein L6